MTFGIPVQLLPLTVEGNPKLDNHRLWVEQRRNLERNPTALRSQNQYDIDKGDEESIDRCVVPAPTDVLLGRDKISRSHIGNVRFDHLIDSRQEQYDGAMSKDERSILAADIVLLIKEAGGRFLKLDQASWVTVDDESARDKVTSAFRTRRRSRRLAEQPAKVAHETMFMSTSLHANQEPAQRLKRQMLWF